MSQKLVRELVIPRCEGRAFDVLNGQLFRVIAIDESKTREVGQEAKCMIARPQGFDRDTW